MKRLARAKATISAPVIPLSLFQVENSFVSNWVSTYENDYGIRNWIQSGWLLHYSYSIPLQYVEWCIDCIGNQGTYVMQNQFAYHNWGTFVDYWVDRDGNSSRWCGYTSGIVRYCVDGIHDHSVLVMAKSEITNSIINPIDTYFFQIRYKDVVDGIWRYVQSPVWHVDYPYAVDVFSESDFHTYRLGLDQLFLPALQK